MREKTGKILGPLLGLGVWWLAEGLDEPSRRLAGLMAWVVVWWVCEVVPLAITALLGAAMTVVLGVTDAKTAFAPFAHPLIFLFMGGFIIARAMSVHGLDRRVAYLILTHPWIRGNPWRSLVGLFGTSFFLSMWISNTAATAMMFPIALGILGALFPEGDRDEDHILIGLAYCASLGGIVTPVGSPPNVIALGMLDKLTGIRPTFFEWMVFSMPIAVVSFGLLLAHIRFRLPALPKTIDTHSMVEARRRLGTLSLGERNVLVSVLLACVLWVGPGLLALLLGKDHFVYVWLRDHLPEAVSAVLAVIVLFLLPNKEKPNLTWKQAVDIDWSSLLLFGGGLSLGSLMFQTGLAPLVGGVLIEWTGGGGAPWTFVLVCITFTVFFTEATSNTASANMLIPLVIAAAQKTGMDPLIPTLGVTLACSMAFMLPVSTPPNAIVYGSGRVRLLEMIKLGFLMNIACIGVLMASLWALDSLRAFF